jgi:hypothetical protein
MDFTLPFLMWKHSVDQREHLVVHFFVPTLPTEVFRIRLDPNDSRVLLFGIQLPSFYPANERLDAVHAGDAAFNENTHKNTSYKSLANRVEKAYKDGSSSFKYISDTPGAVRLPFPCEEDVAWEAQYYPIEDDGLTDTLGREQFACVSEVELVSVFKPKTRAVGRTRVVRVGGAGPAAYTDTDDREI